jgi:hypothetical protein
MTADRYDPLDDITRALVGARIRLVRVRRSPPMLVARLDAAIAEAEALKLSARRS